MSGHSKWSTIKRQKGVADNKRGQLFTKLSNSITIAVKQGGGVSDPESNFKLRLIIDKARAANMPKENIERAINRAKESNAKDVSELLYEGFGPGGVAMMVETVTDNKQRTVSSVKMIFEKNGGTLGSSGTVAYLFERRGEIVAKRGGLGSEDLLGMGIDAGATDVEEEGESVFYYFEPQNLASAKAALEKAGLTIESAQLMYAPINYLDGDSSIQEKLISLIDKLEELDDVQQVYTNLAIS